MRRQRKNRCGVGAHSHSAAKIGPDGKPYGRNGYTRAGRSLSKGIARELDEAPTPKARTLSDEERAAYAEELALRPSHFATRRMGGA